MPKPKHPLKPFKAAVWNPVLRRWEGNPPRKINARVFISELRKWPNLKPKKKKHKKSARLLQYERVKLKWRHNHDNNFCRRCSDLGYISVAENYPHHKKGRAGDLLFDTTFFMPICEPCHVWIHGHVALSYNRGWLIKSGSKITQ